MPTSRVLPAFLGLCLQSLCLLGVCGAELSAADLPAPTGEKIVDPGAKLEHLFQRSAPIKGGLTEGPTVAPDGSIYFSDIPMGSDKGLIMRFDPKTKKTEIFAQDSHKSNGLKFDAQGKLVACEGADYGGRAITRWDVSTKQRSIVTDNYQGKKYNAPNDLCIDSKGRIYFSDPKYVGAEPRELEHRAVYRVSPNGKVEEVTHEVEKPNGVVLSPDEKTLYVADHNNGNERLDIPAKEVAKRGAMKILAFPLNAEGLVNGPVKVLHDFGDQPGCDGMTVDAQGNIYITCRSPKRPGVMVLDPQGKEAAFIPTGISQALDTAEPVGLPSNVTFGIGAESKTLYITIDLSLYRVPLKVEGWHHSTKK